jgi:hypothetical protein
MLLLGLPLAFGALALSVGVIEYRPDDSKPTARETARKKVAPNESAANVRIQSRYLLDDSVVETPRPGPKQDLWLLEPQLPTLHPNREADLANAALGSGM